MSTLAVYPGSFDPLTNGHVDIIARGARLFDRIIVAILVNAEKAPLFTVEERVDIARAVFKERANVEVDTFDGLLVDYVERRRAQVIVRLSRALRTTYHFLPAPIGWAPRFARSRASTMSGTKPCTRPPSENTSLISRELM